MDINHTVEDLLRVARDIGYGRIPTYQSNECFTSGAFDLIVFHGSERAEKFALMSALCDQYGRIKSDRKFLEGYFYLLEQLSYATDTTERPKGLEKIIEENLEETRSLQEWYRVRR